MTASSSANDQCAAGHAWYDMMMHVVEEMVVTLQVMEEIGFFVPSSPETN